MPSAISLQVKLFARHLEPHLKSGDVLQPALFVSPKIWNVRLHGREALDFFNNSN